MTMNMLDDLFREATRPSLRIAPLHDPFASSSRSSARPSPLEPNTLVNLDDNGNKLTGRRKALAQAKLLDAPDGGERDSVTPYSDLLVAEASSKKRTSRSGNHEPITEFVQLPKPSAKAGQEKPRPFRPVSVLNELHEPPPSVALFPPITPNASQEEEGGRRDRCHEPRGEKRSGRTRRKKFDERSISPAAPKRTYTRGRTRWTQDEVDDLIKGVTIYGMGRWKNILEHPDLHFQPGRTPTDLKDRFRVSFPPNACSRPVKPAPNDDGMSNESNIPLQVMTDELLQKTERPAQRARKRHWTEAEDAELEKGFRQYGYNWNAMVKDPNLHFDGRSGGQIRDRFRLKFKDLYEGQDLTHVPNKAAERADPQRKRHSEQNATTENPRDSSIHLRNDGVETADQFKMTSRTPSSSTLINGEEELSRLSNSILHNDLEWDDNLTLAPLTWEDMAARPIFPFD
ncbi:hypothetical protein ACLMJK_009000 [Lecanora helva]